MYFCYGVGALLASLVAMPFLSDVRCHGNLLNGSARGQAARAATQQRTEFFSQVQYAYWIFSGVQLPVPLLVGVLAFKYGEVLPSDSTSTSDLKTPHAAGAPDAASAASAGFSRMFNASNRKRAS